MAADPAIAWLWQLLSRGLDGVLEQRCRYSRCDHERRRDHDPLERERAGVVAEDGPPQLARPHAEVAGHEGASIMQTLAARAESMRAEALAATKAKAGSRSTTMVVPIALLGAGFLLLLVFPMVYRSFG